uniref:OSJNBa0019J05.3 protein n=1 Tax=Oryza sativa subsp. japonica TaxID=39947 RepID=Q7FA02_ORYSJ|nr:OSJNBa0019J05.3 [Oryza sativa Japonica Group]CAE02146.2 OSJNBa0071G03.14 [Oryza sativa Japonica Group]
MGKLDEAKHVLARMKAAEVASDVVFFNTLLAGFVADGRFEDAFELAWKMEQRGCPPTTATSPSLHAASGSPRCAPPRCPWPPGERGPASLFHTTTVATTATSPRLRIAFGSPCLAPAPPPGERVGWAQEKKGRRVEGLERGDDIWAPHISGSHNIFFV